MHYFEPKIFTVHNVVVAKMGSSPRKQLYGASGCGQDWYVAAAASFVINGKIISLTFFLSKLLNLNNNDFCRTFTNLDF